MHRSPSSNIMCYFSLELKPKMLAERRSICLCSYSAVDLSGWLPVERFLLWKAPIYIVAPDSSSGCLWIGWMERGSEGGRASGGLDWRGSWTMLLWNHWSRARASDRTFCFVRDKLRERMMRVPDIHPDRIYCVVSLTFFIYVCIWYAIYVMGIAFSCNIKMMGVLSLDDTHTHSSCIPLKLNTVWNSGPWENVEGCSYRRAPPLRRWLDACLFMQMPIGKEWRSNDKDGGSGQAGDFTALLWRKQGKWKTLTECGTDRYFIPKLRSLVLSIRHTFFILRDDCLSKNTLYCNSELHSHLRPT